jgi:hypothetical protein
MIFTPHISPLWFENQKKRIFFYQASSQNMHSPPQLNNFTSNAHTLSKHANNRTNVSTNNKHSILHNMQISKRKLSS